MEGAAVERAVGMDDDPFVAGSDDEIVAVAHRRRRAVAEPDVHDPSAGLVNAAGTRAPDASSKTTPPSSSDTPASGSRVTAPSRSGGTHRR